MESGFVDYIRDQLRGWTSVSAKRMFGGHGLFRGDTMFALLNGEALYLRTDEVNQPDFEEAGMAPFSYHRAGKLVELAYHEVPAEVIEESDQLARWAEKAYAAALRRKTRLAAAGRKPRAKKSRRAGA